MNFLPDTASATDFIRTSLEVLRDECPQAYQEMCSLMDGKDLSLRIGEEPVELTFRHEGVDSFSLAEDKLPGLQLRADWQTILDLADARLTLTEAVLVGRLDLFGRASELPVLHEAILTYLRGAVRCPSFPDLLDQARLAHGNR